MLVRIQVIGHPHSRIPAWPVGGGNVGQEVERKVGVSPKGLEHRAERGRVHHQRDLAPCLEDVLVPRRQRGRQVRRAHLTFASRRTFAWSLRIPYMSISGRGGHPAV